MDRVLAFAGVFLALLLGFMVIIGLNQLFRRLLARLASMKKAWLVCPHCRAARALKENESLNPRQICAACGREFYVSGR